VSVIGVGAGDQRCLNFHSRLLFFFLGGLVCLVWKLFSILFWKAQDLVLAYRLSKIFQKTSCLIEDKKWMAS